MPRKEKNPNYDIEFPHITKSPVTRFLWDALTDTLKAVPGFDAAAKRLKESRKRIQGQLPQQEDE